MIDPLDFERVTVTTCLSNKSKGKLGRILVRSGTLKINRKK